MFAVWPVGRPLKPVYSEACVSVEGCPVLDGSTEDQSWKALEGQVPPPLIPTAWILILQAPEHNLSRAELSVFPTPGPFPDFFTKMRFSEAMKLPWDVWARPREKSPCAHSPLALPHIPGALRPTSMVSQGIPDVDKMIAFYR